MSTDLTALPTVPGVMKYLSERSTVLRRFTAPGESVNTGEYEDFEVAVRNGRPLQDAFTLEDHGFELRTLPSAVKDFTDRDELARVYGPEIEAFVKERTGADEVALLGPTLRRAADPKENDSQPAAGLVHIDFSPEGAPAHVQEMYEKHFPNGQGYRRAKSTSVWRVFSPPPQDWPLAVCDFSSLEPDEGLPNTLYFVEQVPEDPFGPVPPTTRSNVSGSEFHHKPHHRWYYFPDMNREEVLFFTFHDSDHESGAWRVMHSAFHDLTARATVPRHSVEFRSVAYFH